MPDDYDVAVIGGGPAGLSAAITLSRARRRVVVFDHNKPRNYASRGVHCFLGLDGVTPAELRAKGRREAEHYGATFVDREVDEAKCTSADDGAGSSFLVTADRRQYSSRALLLATGMLDHLPKIPGLNEAYGATVHHCPYCDGYEHRDQTLVALGSGASGPRLGAELLAWSARVTVCTNGEQPEDADLAMLRRLGIAFRGQAIERLDGDARRLHFADGTSIACEALFFSSGQAQKSRLPELLGCVCNEKGLLATEGKQCTAIAGLYVAGDADGDVQFAVVAAAEGAIAATAIHKHLLEQDHAN